MPGPDYSGRATLSQGQGFGSLCHTFVTTHISHSHISKQQADKTTRLVTGRSLRISIHFTQKGFEILVNKELLHVVTRPVTGRSLRIYRHFTQKGFEILVDKELSNTRKLIETS